MKSNAIATSGSSTMTIILGILAALLVFAVLTGRKVPLLANERIAVLVLVAIGMAMCTSGIGRVAAQGEWLHPLAIVAYLIGAAILLVGIAALFGRNIPPLTSYYQSFSLVAILAVVKLVISALHRLL